LWDADTGDLTIKKNGAAYYSGAGVLTPGALYGAYASISNAAAGVTFDFGQAGYSPSVAGHKTINASNLEAADVITAGISDEGDYVYTGGTLVSVTWDSTEYTAAAHDGSVIRFHGTGFVPQSGAGNGKAWTAVIETPVGVRRSMQPRAVLA
jgi:hypothetical protein